MEASPLNVMQFNFLSIIPLKEKTERLEATVLAKSLSFGYAYLIEFSYE